MSLHLIDALLGSFTTMSWTRTIIQNKSMWLDVWSLGMSTVKGVNILSTEDRKWMTFSHTTNKVRMKQIEYFPRLRGIFGKTGSRKGSTKNWGDSPMIFLSWDHGTLPKLFDIVWQSSQTSSFIISLPCCLSFPWPIRFGSQLTRVIDVCVPMSEERYARCSHWPFHWWNWW